MSLFNTNDLRCLATPKRIRCRTCLSLDRELKPLIEKNILALLCPELFPKATPTFMSAIQMVCWECSAMILKIKEFRSRVRKAQAILELSSKKCYYCEDLSTLKTTKLETVYISPEPSNPLPNVIHETTEPKTLDVIIAKIEPLSEEDESLSKEDKLLSTEVEPFTAVEVKKEKKDTLCNDYDKPIQPMTIQQSDSGESTDTASECGMEADDDCDPLLTERTVRDEPKKLKRITKKMDTSNLNYKPQNDLKNTPIPPIAGLRGLKEMVKVTASVSNLVISTNGDPTTIQKSVPNAANNKYTASTVKNINEVQQGIYGFDNEEVKCKIMTTAEMEKYVDTKKNDPVFKGTPYKCIKCIERFVTKEKLDIHNKKHDVISGNFVCDVCEQRFIVRKELNQHYMAHFIVYECLTCGFQNNDRYKISEHIRRRHQVSEFDCNKCNSSFKTYKELRGHKMRFHFKKPSCKHCGKSFSSRSTLKCHEASYHRGERVTCATCGKKVKAHCFKSHMKTHEDKPEDAAYCVECNVYLKNKDCYNIHIKKSLKHNSIERIGFKCDMCGKCVASKSTLSDHIELEHNGNQSKYTCKVCKNVYKSIQGLKYHIQYQHEGKKPKEKKTVVCEICGKVFKDKKHLACHIDSHYGRRPFKCQDCGNTFTYAGALWTHRKLVHKVKKISEMKKAEMKSEVKK